MKLITQCCIFLLLLVSVYANCGITTKTGNGPDTLKYSFSTTSVETCTWTLNPVYDSVISTLPDKKTMLIMTIDEWSQSISGQLSLLPSTKFSKNDAGKCFRFIQSTNDQCEDAHFKHECSTEIIRLDQAALFKYKLVSLGWGLKFTVSYRFAKCDEAPPTSTKTITTPPPPPMTTTKKQTQTDPTKGTDSDSGSRSSSLSLVHIGLIIGGLLIIVIGLVLYIVFARKPKGVTVYKDDL